MFRPEPELLGAPGVLAPQIVGLGGHPPRRTERFRFPSGGGFRVLVELGSHNDITSEIPSADCGKEVCAQNDDLWRGRRKTSMRAPCHTKAI